MTAARASVVEALRQLVDNNPSDLQLNEVPLYLRRGQEGEAPHVAVLSGGGSGHEPMHVGFVGRGMLDAACPGHIFTSPSVEQITSAARAVETGRGCLFIVKNYAGDRMNFQLAVEELPFDSEIVLVDDDISFPAHMGDGRRGIAGTFIIEKIAGAASARGYSLKACADLARKAVSSTYSIGAAWRWCSRSIHGRAMYDLPIGQMSYGVGLHGEPGVQTIPMMNDARLVRRMIGDLCRETGADSAAKILLLTNALGHGIADHTKIIHHLALQEMTRCGLSVSRNLAGTFATCLDMEGISLTFSVFDEELLSLWDDQDCIDPQRRARFDFPLIGSKPSSSDENCFST